MISAVLYGRNDSYGYNLHKRAALSINCISEVLTEPDDELLFVDYNTPDDFPTFPEAIQDTLTDKAKERLRILRVRPTVHDRYKNLSHLIALEPIARNVAIRRSNPSNRWVLSTNTDMIFVPHHGVSISSYVKDLPKGFYHLPRFEIPETLWETFDRQDAVGTIGSIREWAQIAHLNEVVRASDYILYDGPGDFQLIERDELFRIHGFHESMLLGWHVDSNIAKRLHMVYGETRSLLDCIYGYHCDHTRQVTPAHKKDSKSNDIGTFIDRIEQPECPEQAESWGCVHDEIEEIRLSNTRNRVYMDGIKNCIAYKMNLPTYSDYVTNTYNKVTYDAKHVLPFLADIFVNAPPKIRIGWIGTNNELLTLFAKIWPELNPGGKIAFFAPTSERLEASSPLVNPVTTLDQLDAEADAFVFDYFVSDEIAKDRQDSKLAKICSSFVHLVGQEQVRLSQNASPRRFVGVNAIHNTFEQFTNQYLHTARTPFSSRIRQGFVVKIQETGGSLNGGSRWIDRMQVGEAGAKDGSVIRTVGNKPGLVTFGPYVPIIEGHYQVDLEINTCRLLRPKRIKDMLRSEAKVKVVAGSHVLGAKKLKRNDLYDAKLSFEFSCSREQIAKFETPLEVKVWTNGSHELEIRNIQTRKIG
jgi:hypothetical protein